MNAPVVLLAELDPEIQSALEALYDCRAATGEIGQAGIEASWIEACPIAVTHAVRGLSAADLEALPGLKMVASLGAGTDAIDLDGCAARGIVVTTTPHALTEDVADLALGLMIAAVRQICIGDRYVRDGKWVEGRMPVTASLQGRTAGILGLGRIGSAIARRCSALGMSIAYSGPRERKSVDYRFFPDALSLASAADILIVACPGGAATSKIVSMPVLEALGGDGFLVNIARGSVVDEDALVRALDNGVISGAALDVFENEPAVPASLCRLDRVVLQPHQGSATGHARQAMGGMLLESVASFVEGERTSVGTAAAL